MAPTTAPPPAAFNMSASPFPPIRLSRKARTMTFRFFSSHLRSWARRLKQEVATLYLASRHPRVPWHAKLLAVLVVAYAVSPIDLIPDFIPVLGYLDDLLILPLGVAITLKLIPPGVLADCRQAARDWRPGGIPRNRVAGGVIVAIWVIMAAAGLLLVLHSKGVVNRLGNLL